MTSDLLVGTSFGGYEILAKIGVGGMGAVYQARHTQLNRVVAIKFLSPELVDSESLARFQREVQMASALNHPHIVTVIEAGTLSGRPYLVTEYMAGGTLREWARTRRSFPQVLGMLIGVGDGLAAAHSAGILHRDVKPENILLTKEHFAKVADFGAAKLLDAGTVADDAATAMRTRTGFIIGTTAYMSPEQALGQELSAGSDIFSFGVVLYELLAGRHPFAGKTRREVIDAILHRQQAPLDESLPLAVRMIVEKALEKDPAERYQSMHDLVADIRRVVRRRATAAPGVAVEEPRPAPAAPPPVWRQSLGDAIGIICLVVGLFAVRAYLDWGPVGEHVKSLEYALLQQGFLSGSDASSQWDKDDPRLPIVIDISYLRPDKTVPTDRTRLTELVDELRSLNAAAIGLDIDFSPDDAGNFVTPADPQLFDKWKKYANVRVGVFRREGDLPRRWLGRAEFQDLAAGMLLPSSAPFLAAQFSTTQHVPSEQPSYALLEMPAALYEVVNPGSRSRLLENPRLTRLAIDRIVLGRFPVDFSFTDRIQTIPYRQKGDLDRWRKQIERRVVLVGDTADSEDLRCTPARMEAVSGVLIHASALATLNRGILQHPDDRRNLTYNASVGLAALLVILGVRLLRARAASLRTLDAHAIDVVAFTSAAIVVAVAGVVAIGIGRIFWPDALWLALGLFLFPHVKNVWRIGLRWLRGVVGTPSSVRSVSHAN